MHPMQDRKRAMQDAERAYVEAARAHFEGPLAGTTALEGRYKEKLESLVAAYEAYELSGAGRA
ncbi:MAG TPA: hypothetical protein VM370_05815 [Candidatus Thermoplasmatota archaeon]|nr:hypothetical protein [Candidatus Thermoplasmatota archaeon]